MYKLSISLSGGLETRADTRAAMWIGARAEVLAGARAATRVGARVEAGLAGGQANETRRREGDVSSMGGFGAAGGRPRFGGTAAVVSSGVWHAFRRWQDTVSVFSPICSLKKCRLRSSTK